MTCLPPCLLLGSSDSLLVYDPATTSGVDGYLPEINKRAVELRKSLERLLPDDARDIERRANVQLEKIASAIWLDEAGWLRPSTKTIKQAKLLLSEISTNLDFAHSPNVVTSPEGEIVLEFWAPSKKLSLYVSEDSIDFLKIWRNHPEGKMLEGKFADINPKELFEWLSK